MEFTDVQALNSLAQVQREATASLSKQPNHRSQVDGIQTSDLQREGIGGAEQFPRMALLLG